MNSESGHRSEYRHKSTARPYVAIAAVAGAAFAVVALLDAPGIAYVIVAVVAGAGYSVTAAVSRGRR